jgi:hypothetical protein
MASTSMDNACMNIFWRNFERDQIRDLSARQVWALIFLWHWVGGTLEADQHLGMQMRVALARRSSGE